MKKSLVALAALAATASFAQSSVTIDGGLDAGWANINYKGNSVNGVLGNGSSTSQINFRGNQDLGGGLKAEFRVESDWNTVSNKANTGAASTATTLGQETLASGGSFGNGEIRVGLIGDFGRVDLGAPNFNGLGVQGVANPYGTAIGGGYGSVLRVDAAGTAVRDENAIKYTSPTFSGLNFTVYKSAKQTKAGATAATATKAGTQETSFSTTLGAYDKLGSQEIGLNYANGPLAAGYNTLKQDSVGVGTGTTATTVNTLAGAYTMGAWKVSGLNQTVKTTTGTVATDTAFSAVYLTYTVGNYVLMGSTGNLKQDVGTYAGLSSKINSFGADYNLSKTTALYARYEKIDDKAGAITATAVDGSDTARTRTAIGLRTTF